MLNSVMDHLVSHKNIDNHLNNLGLVKQIIVSLNLKNQFLFIVLMYQ